ncbi:MAG: low molecular weight protein-tyrosine-phosphatase [Haliscomenobacter sp.]
MRILMVCLGNICRSPLAEGVLRHKIQAAGLDWEVDSAGTGGWHRGELPDRRSIAVSRNHGIDITYQRARQLQPTDFQQFDLILVMDKSNLQEVQRLAPDTASRSKVRLLLDYAHGQLDEVPDPYYDDQAFEPVFQMIHSACEEIIQKG